MLHVARWTSILFRYRIAKTLIRLRRWVAGIRICSLHKVNISCIGAHAVIGSCTLNTYAVFLRYFLYNTNACLHGWSLDGDCGNFWLNILISQNCLQCTYISDKAHYLTFCSFHRIEQNICLVGTSFNKGCAVYYYSVVMHGLRIIRYLWTKCREKSVLRRLHRREQHTKSEGRWSIFLEYEDIMAST